MKLVKNFVLIVGMKKWILFWHPQRFSQRIWMLPWFFNVCWEPRKKPSDTPINSPINTGLRVKCCDILRHRILFYYFLTSSPVFLSIAQSRGDGNEQDSKLLCKVPFLANLTCLLVLSPRGNAPWRFRRRQYIFSPYSPKWIHCFLPLHERKDLNGLIY